MLMYILQTAVWIILALLLGFLIGWLLRKLFASEEPKQESQNDYRPKEPDTAPAPPPAPTPATVLREEAVSEEKPTLMSANRPAQAAMDSHEDNLTLIKGIGLKYDKVLKDLGIKTFEQIAKWDQDNVDWINGYLDFGHRVEREDWVGQAKKLAEGEATEFSKRVAAGEVPSSKKE